MAAAIGAHYVTNDTRGDFTQAREKHDLVTGIAGNQTLAGTRRVLVPKGCWRRPEARTRPPARSIRTAVPAPAVSQTMVFFLAQQNTADPAVPSEPLQAGKVWSSTRPTR
jgi:hypothetical protein